MAGSLYREFDPAFEVQWDDPDMGSFDYDAIYKLPRDARYVNISVFWIPYFPLLVRVLYALRVPHEIVTLGSIASGLVAGWVIWTGQSYGSLIVAAILVHLKDLFDACDGSLARLTGTGHRVGRFLDTIGDGIVFTAWIAAVALRVIDAGADPLVTLIVAAATWLSLFLQCSYFNLYHLQYTTRVGGNTLSQIDESQEGSRHGSGLLRILRAIYRIWFGWQDRLVQAIDTHMRPSVDTQDTQCKGDWYTDRRFLTANSALCYGTHAFILILCLIARRPQWFFAAVAIGMNVYWLGILLARRIVSRRMVAWSN